jgi:tRNA (guanine-N7-)-methyltransferase
MVDGAELRIATDDETYKAWAQQQMAARPDFVLATDDPAVKAVDWPATRYESKALEQGRAPIYLSYRRLPRAVLSPV